MDRLAATCERVASDSSRLKKVALLAGYFRTLGDEDLARAVRFLCCRERVSAGHATLRAAAMAATGWDLETLRICHREVGDTGETIALLLAGCPGDLPLPLAEAETIYAALSAARTAAAKTELLRQVFTRRRPQAVKYFVKIITGNLRIGLQEKMVEEAVAQASGVSHEAVRQANNRAGDLPRVALACRRGGLHAVEARLFHPMDFMLAKPLDSLMDFAEPGQWWAEDKYDGIRSQVHCENGRVRIYTRGFEDATASFPEVVLAMRKLGGAAVIDGEILGWKDGRPLPFNVLQQRIARKKLTPGVMEEVPAALMAYDLMYRGTLVLDLPIEERRRLLDELPVMRSPLHSPSSIEEVERLFSEARERGNEGLVLKRRGSLYEAGRRSGAWLKLKRPYATLDVVITAAEQGHGRRAAVLSDYTFGVRSGEGYVNVGKAYSGLTGEEIRELTRRLRAAASDRFGRVFLVRPEIVLEVAFDGVRKSPRHKSGFALRFPRIVRWRRDKKPAECDTIERVEELYEASLR
mgnify:CR=1 FL=1